MAFITDLKQRVAGSLALRWALLVTLVAGVGLALMVHAVDRAMRNKIETESARLTEIASQKVAERMEIEARLGDQRLRQMVMRYEQELASLARQPRMPALLRSRNEAQIASILAREFQRIGFEGGLMLDASLAVLGGSRADFSISSAESALKRLDIADGWQGMISGNIPDAPNSSRFVGGLGVEFESLFQIPLRDRYGLIVATPLFDEFGDIAGMLVGLRLIAPVEPTLVDFSNMIRASVLLLRDQGDLSRAGGVHREVPDFDRNGLQSHPDLQLFSLCVASLPRTRFCVFRQEEEVLRFRDELKVLSASESSRMQWRLAAFASGLAVLIGWFIILLTKRLTGPLTDIASEVSRVAGGDWTAAVRHVNRADEVGRIARAIEAMQYALIERDRMRQEMVRIDAINQRRFAMGEAIGRFESSMQDVMGKIAQAAGALDGASHAIGQAARSAEKQADRIRETTVATATEASLVTGATIQLTAGMEEIGQRLRSARAIVGAGEAEARAAEDHLDDITRLAREVEEATSTVQGHVADLASRSLGASLQAAESGAAGKGYLPAADALSRVAGETGYAVQRIAEVIARLASAAEHASARYGEINARFAEVGREADGMAIVMAEQDAARRSISEGLASASKALEGLNESVEELRQSLAGAERATGDVAETARRILADAQAIDESLRSFVQEVAA